MATRIIIVDGNGLCWSRVDRPNGIARDWTISRRNAIAFETEGLAEFARELLSIAYPDRNITLLNWRR